MSPKTFPFQSFIILKRTGKQNATQFRRYVHQIHIVHAFRLPAQHKLHKVCKFLGTASLMTNILHNLISSNGTGRQVTVSTFKRGKV